jgi:hypothetical protein
MRRILATFVGVCLLGFVVGCGSKPAKTELPSNPTPPPTVRPVSGGARKAAPGIPPPLPGAQPAPAKK